MRHLKLILAAVFTLALTLIAMPRTMAGQARYSIQVGAYGNDASRGNMGVRAEIRTSITPPIGEDLGDSFWVGDGLQNDAFVQFGYALSRPGYYCLYGETMEDQGNCLGSVDRIGYGDGRWFWEYWPNPTAMDFYYAVGPANSTGPVGSWHAYQISPDAASGWNFVLDGCRVWSFNMFPAVKSTTPAYMVAEELSGSPSASGSLGPVEFSNLQYWDSYKTWQPVTSLRAISECGGTSLKCGRPIPYGVTALGQNHIIAGTGEQPTNTGSLLWSTTFTLTASTPSDVCVRVDPLAASSGLRDLKRGELSEWVYE
jgi:hypothetical protein